MSEEKPLNDSTVLITGASSGIGRATAHELASLGANVSVSARREERLRDLAATIEKEYQVEAIVKAADVTSVEAVESLVDTTVNQFNGLDIVVSNAGVGREEDAIEDLSEEAYHQMMDVNCNGMFYLTQAAIPHLKESNGNIIFVASMSGQYPRPASPVYAATKWWTRGLALSLAGSAGPEGVGVTAINPTEVRTEFGSEDGNALVKELDADEAAEPSDIAKAIGFAARQDPPNVVQELDFYRRDKFKGW